jgi:hypothetical protein
MNLIRYLTHKEVPSRCKHEYWLITYGNEFSDEKSAMIAINKLIKVGNKPFNTIRIPVYQAGGGKPIYYYTATL